jgi:hypothetical protein
VAMRVASFIVKRCCSSLPPQLPTASTAMAATVLPVITTVTSADHRRAYEPIQIGERDTASAPQTKALRPTLDRAEEVPRRTAADSRPGGRSSASYRISKRYGDYALSGCSSVAWCSAAPRGGTSIG